MDHIYHWVSFVFIMDNDVIEEKSLSSFIPRKGDYLKLMCPDGQVKELEVIKVSIELRKAWSADLTDIYSLHIYLK